MQEKVTFHVKNNIFAYDLKGKMPSFLKDDFCTF